MALTTIDGPTKGAPVTPDLHHIQALLATVQLGLRQAIIDQLNAHPRAQHFDSDRTTGGGGTDPTANAATHPDQNGARP